MGTLTSEWLHGVPHGWDYNCTMIVWVNGEDVVTARDVESYRTSHTCRGCGIVSGQVQIVFIPDKRHPFNKKKMTTAFLCPLCLDMGRADEGE